MLEDLIYNDSELSFILWSNSPIQAFTEAYLKFDYEV